MLEDVLLKIGGKTGKNVGEKGSGQSASLSRSGSTVMESVASRSFFSLPTITESFDSDCSQQPCCSSRQADAALGFSRTEVNEFNDTDSLRTLGQIRSDVRKKGELYKWSQEGRPNPIAPSGSDGGGYVFTEEMLELAPFAKIFATVPENFLCVQMCDFLHRLLRRIVSWSCLPSEWDWDALRSFDFGVSELLDIPGFMQKTEFRSKVLKVAKSKIDVERERGKKARSDAEAKTVMGESFNPFVDQGRQHVRYVAKELVKHPTFKSDLVIGLTCFDYGVFFNLPETVAVYCYQHLFQSFSSRGWVARELRNVHIDDYIEFVDDVRHVYLDELGAGPDVGDMVSFLSSCPELSRRRYTWDLFKLSCLFLGHVAPKLPDVSLGSSKVGVTSVDLSSRIEPLQGYF